MPYTVICSSYGPIFGNGHDLAIYSNYMEYTTSYTIGENAYDVLTYELNDGERYFRVKDYVIVQAESLWFLSSFTENVEGGH